MKIAQIHQFSFACSAGDGVTNSMLYIRKMLRQLGFESEIYCETIPVELQGDILDVSALKVEPTTLLLSHHCLGYDNWRWLLDLALPKVMVYHNITPTDLLPEDGDIRRWADLGREQLHDWAPHFLGAIGVSKLNSDDLVKNSYANIATIPMLVDFDKMENCVPDLSELSMLRDSYNVLFVGRICENKKQLDLIDFIHHLRYRSETPVRLILAGAVTSGHYKALIEARIQELSLEQHVIFMGKVSDQKLLGLYRSADAFVCMSAHEGFGMPLIEAMHHRVPVIARNSSNIADTLGEGGILLDANASPWDCAAAVWTLMNEPALKRHILARQGKNLARFSNQYVLKELVDYLQSLGISAPSMPQQEELFVPKDRWQIEGPFDSSYSLAIVNRELAKALDARGVDVALRSHEGHGDFLPSADFLKTNLDCARLFEKATSAKLPPEIALRFCFPPYLDEMAASARVVHSYGWEETGFPQEYVAGFNRRLDLVTVLSHTVGKTLRDNGVRVPIVVTGAGVDHLLQLAPEALPNGIESESRAFRFLHISSCFPRKGVDVLLRAYGAAFRFDDPVTLIIKTFQNVHNEVAADLKNLQKSDTNFPHVLLVFEELTQGQLVSLYQFSHAFVAPSRGEGLGLPMAEAMLFEVPVITTAWGGQTEFADASTAWCCDYQFTKTSTHMQLTHSLWAEPSQVHLSQLLTDVYGATDQQRTEKTALAKQRILANFTWDKTAENVMHAIQALGGQSLLRKDPKIGWLSTWNARCGIANYSHFLTQKFPESRLTILANHVAERMDFEHKNVVRCWTQSDEETLTYALETIAEQNIEAVVIQYNFGFYTLNTLAAFIQQLKAQGRAVYVFFHSTADVSLPDQFKTLSSIRDTLAIVDRIIVHGVDDVNRLKAWNLIDNVTYFPHGIPAASPHAIMSKGTEKSVSEYAKKTVIASYGFLLPHKGILELIEAFSLLDHAQKEYQLLLLNALYPVDVSENLAAKCHELIARLGLTSKVNFVTDFLSEHETHQLLASAELIVFPYQQTQESSSAAVRVGLAVGCAVAVTPLSIFEDVEDAVLQLPGTTAAEIAQGIAELLSAPDELLSKREQVKTWLAERQWPALSHRLLNLIDGIANPLGNHTRSL